MNSTNQQQTKQEILIRAKTGIYMGDLMLKDLESAQKISNDGNLGNQVHFSRDGKYLLVHEKQRIFTLENGKMIGQVEGTNFQSVAISPGNKFALAMDKTAVDQFKLHLVEFPSLKSVEVSEYKRYKKEQWPLVKFSHNDNYLLKIENKELKVIESSTLKLVKTYNCNNCEYFSVQPGNQDLFMIVCYQLSQDLTIKDNQAHIMIFYFNKTSMPIFQKSMEKASEMEVCWSPDGQNLVLTASQNQDTSNQSYFGQTQVFHYQKEKREFKLLPTYEGPIHAVKWAPDSQSFVIISGFMPAGMVLFTKDGLPSFEFGKDHKNQLYWSPMGRFILICGFGNLDGSIDIWDTVQKKLVGKCKAKSTSMLVWSPCGRKFLVAKVTPRMNVDNQYTIFDYQGCEILTHSFANSELYEVQFRPVPQGTFQDRPPSPPRNSQLQATTQPQKKLFVPPGGSGALAQQLRAQKASEGARTLSANENFGNSSQQGWGLAKAPLQYPVGFIPEEKKEKKKRIRHRKNKDEKDDDV